MFTNGHKEFMCMQSSKRAATHSQDQSYILLDFCGKGLCCWNGQSVVMTCSMPFTLLLLFNQDQLIVSWSYSWLLDMVPHHIVTGGGHMWGCSLDFNRSLKKAVTDLVGLPLWFLL